MRVKNAAELIEIYRLGSCQEFGGQMLTKWKSWLNSQIILMLGHEYVAHDPCRSRSLANHRLSLKHVNGYMLRKVLR